MTIDSDKITIPPVGFQRRLTEITFAKLHEINETKVNGNYILTLYFENGKRSIVSSLLFEKSDYEEIKKLIKESMI